MTNVKYQIFVSSTFEDLKKERDQVMKAILEMGHIPVGMEMFSAGDDSQWLAIKRQIEQSDYYVVIIAHRYGSLDGEISFTEKEWQYACEKNLPVIGFIIEEDAKWNPKYIDKEQEIKAKLDQFKEKAKKKMVSFWKNADDLYGKAGIAIMKEIGIHPRVGWIRADNLAGPEVLKELSRLSGENANLRESLIEKEKKLIFEDDKKIVETITLLYEIDINMMMKKKYTKIHSKRLVSLLDIFHVAGKYLINGTTEKQIMMPIAVEVGQADAAMLEPNSPIPPNHLRSWLTDFVSLGLVKIIDKGNMDTSRWKFTVFGENVYLEMKRRHLAMRRVRKVSP